VAVFDSTDADLIAKTCEWCLLEPKARNQCYNITNGETASLKEWWPLVAEVLGMTAGPEKPLSFTKDIPGWGEEWDKIRARYSLKAPALEPFLGTSGQFSDFVFARGNRVPGQMSCIKIRRDGFMDMLYTDEMIRKWFKMYQDEQLLPPVEGSGNQQRAAKLS